MSLLTKEQQETLDTARDWVNRCKDNVFVHGQYYDDFQKLIAIIDDLQARAPKQYTKAELLEKCAEVFDIRYGAVSYSWRADAWVECARFLGALKAEP